tara:strand:- start:45 stop:638 length:594 start_codon:yes stop_codon:yes gene_type:complete
MKLTGSYKIKLDKKSVWRSLNDPEILKKSIPGCEEFKKKSDTSFEATATNKIGPFNATFTGDIELLDLNPPNSYKITGQGNSPVGFASGEALVQLEESDGITKLTYSVDANIGGKIAQVGSRLIDMTAKKMADIFFGKFSENISLTKMIHGTEAKEDDEPKDVKTHLEKIFDFQKINKKILYLTIITIALLVIYLTK